MTRTQFLASICAIPFIGKLLKKKYTYTCWVKVNSRWEFISFISTEHLGFKQFADIVGNNVRDISVFRGELSKDDIEKLQDFTKPKEWYFVKPGQTDQPHFTGGERKFINYNADNMDVLGYGDDVRL